LPDLHIYLTSNNIALLFQVVTDPTHNIFGYRYEPVTAESNKTGNKLCVLSDVICYNDAFRILKLCYGDETLRHKLEDNFGKKYPHVVRKYFSAIDDIPDHIRKELGL